MTECHYMEKLSLISVCVLILFLGLVSVGCNAQGEDPIPTETTSLAEAKPYEKGTITRTRFQSNYLDINFIVPNGYTMATESELNRRTKFPSGPVYVDGSTTVLDYTKASIVYEMQAAATGNSPIVEVAVENLYRNNMTEEDYLNFLRAELTNRFALADMDTLNYTINDEITTVNLGGRECKQLSATTDRVQGRQLFQDVIVSKYDDRMLVITVSYDQDTRKQMESLMVNFTALSDYDSTVSDESSESEDVNNPSNNRNNSNSGTRSTPNYPTSLPWAGEESTTY